MSATERWLVIPRWDDFQHRDMARSTIPPWIKTYTKLMSDDDFLGLSFHLRGVLVSIWMEYAAARRQLLGSTSTLTRRLGQRVTTRDLESLNHAGFIHFSASKPASNLASEPASLEVEVEKRRIEAEEPNQDQEQEQNQAPASAVARPPASPPEKEGGVSPQAAQPEAVETLSGNPHAPSTTNGHDPDADIPLDTDTPYHRHVRATIDASLASVQP
jgi:hypothetical protein